MKIKVDLAEQRDYKKSITKTKYTRFEFSSGDFFGEIFVGKDSGIKPGDQVILSVPKTKTKTKTKK